MDFTDLLAICRQYHELGWAVLEQVDALLEDRLEEVGANPNALGLIEDWLADIEMLASATGNDQLLADVEDLQERIDRYLYPEGDDANE